MPTSKIEWTQHTWNPIIGCSKAKGSLGCQQCYAINQAYRNEAIAASLVSDGKNPGRLANYQGLTEKRGNRIEWTGKVVFVPEALLVPLKRKKPTMYFVNSMSDLFHESVKFEWIDQIFAVMAICSQHIFQILTKRPERMKKYFEYRDDTGSNKVHLIGTNTIIDLQSRLPLPNVWLGVTCENQEMAEKRVPILMETPAKVRFLSCEPLLEEINLTILRLPVYYGDELSQGRKELYPYPDWIIVGGESGHKARPCHLEWMRALVSECYLFNIPVFVKQLGSNPIDSSPYGDSFSHYPLKLKHSKGGNIDEFPEDLKIREFPN